jgi:hypothetical protein
MGADHRERNADGRLSTIRTGQGSWRSSWRHRGGRIVGVCLNRCDYEARAHKYDNHDACQHNSLNHDASNHDASNHDAGGHDARTDDAAEHQAGDAAAGEYEGRAHEALAHEAGYHGASNHETAHHEAPEWRRGLVLSSSRSSRRVKCTKLMRVGSSSRSSILLIEGVGSSCRDLTPLLDASVLIQFDEDRIDPRRAAHQILQRAPRFIAAEVSQPWVRPARWASSRYGRGGVWLESKSRFGLGPERFVSKGSASR